MSEFPHGWSTKLIGEACDIHDYRRVPLSSEQRRERKGPYPYYGANNIQDRIDDFIFDFDGVLLAEDGGYYDEHEYRDIAQYATGEYWVNNHAHILTGKPGLDTRFLYYALVRKNICPWINTGTRSKLNQSDLKQIELLVPPLPEQKKIAEILSGIDTNIGLLQQEIQAKQHLRSALLSELITDNTPTAKLDSVATRVSGHTPSTSQSHYWNGGIPWISLTDTSKLDNRYISHTAKEISEEGIRNSSAVLHPPGLVILSRDARVGCSAITTRSMAVSQHFVGWICSDKLLNKYLYYLLQKWKYKFKAIAMGSTIPTIGVPFFRDLEIPIPPIEVQEMNAKILESVDNEIAVLSEKVAMVRILKSGVSSDLLLGRKRVSI